MPSGEHRDCYGGMFPPTLRPENDRTVRGKVFAYRLLTAGGIYRSAHDVTADMAAWDACVACEEFEQCYKLSVGRLLLETAISRQ